MKLGYSTAIVDQVVLAGSSAISFIVLANFISLELYGNLATLYSCVILFQMLTNAVFGDAFVIKVPSIGLSKINSYFIFVLKLILISSIVICFLLIVLYMLFWPVQSLRITDFLVTIISAVMFSLFMFSRRLCYSANLNYYSLLGSLIYCSSYSMFLVFCYLFLNLTVATILGSLCLASLAAFLFVVVKTGVVKDFRVGKMDEGILVRLREFHWRYGRWGSLSGIFKWIPDNFLYLLLALGGASEGVAIFRMASNIIMPIRHLIVALVNVMLPKFSMRAFTNHNSDSMAEILKILGVFGLLNLVLIMIFDAYGAEILGLLYISSHVEQVMSVLDILVWVPTLGAGYAFVAVFLKSHNKIKTVFYIALVGACTTVFGGFALIRDFGEVGAAFSLLASIGIMLMLGSYAIFRQSRQ